MRGRNLPGALLLAAGVLLVQPLFAQGLLTEKPQFPPPHEAQPPIEGVDGYDYHDATLRTRAGDIALKVEVADEPDARSMGLMWRKELPRHHGMLFDFGEERMAAMWMRNTLIPLDMLFIRADGTIAQIHRNAQPLDETVIRSNEPVRYVLELRGQAAYAYNLKVGDTFILGTDDSQAAEDDLPIDLLPEG
ncbi:MAG: DUF192 domain-containing protein [Geminicoccaceae bacterium]